MDGWISLYRKIKESIIWSSNEKFDKRSAWIDILLSVNHENKKIIFNNEYLEIKAGEFVTSLRKLADNWKWSITKVDNFLKLLQKEHMIIYKKDTQKTFISVQNWGFYQGGFYQKITQEEHQKRNEKETEIKQEETNNNENNNYTNILCSDDEFKNEIDEALEKAKRLFKNKAN